MSISTKISRKRDLISHGLDYSCQVQTRITASPFRALLYSHDSVGLGHLRRNLNIARALVERFDDASVLVLTGSPCATQFEIPAGVDIVKLPSVTKNDVGDYVSRSLNGSLKTLFHLRRSLILEAFRALSPHLVLVDHQVTGMRDEAIEMLREARLRGVKTILGLRDIVDAPEAVRREWDSDSCRWAFRYGYDRLCVYGTPEVFDPRIEYGLPRELRKRLLFTGYVAPKPRDAAHGGNQPRRPRVVVTMGGGEDGARRIEAYLHALRLAPASWNSHIITGPLLAADERRRLRRLASDVGQVTFRRFDRSLPALLHRSTAVVCMAGYNTSAEVLQSGRPVLFLPRTKPRMEQAIRAERLRRLGLARSLVEPSPIELRREVEALLREQATPLFRPGLDGAEKLCDVVETLVGVNPGVQVSPIAMWK